MTPLTGQQLVEVAANAARNAGAGWKPEAARAALAAALPLVVEALGSTLTKCCRACSAQWHRAAMDRAGSRLLAEVKGETP